MRSPFLNRKTNKKRPSQKKQRHGRHRGGVAGLTKNVNKDDGSDRQYYFGSELFRKTVKNFGHLDEKKRSRKISFTTDRRTSRFLSRLPST